MTDLLPCPFCGGQAEIHATHDVDTGEIDGWFVWCNNKRCECKPETNDYTTEAEAVAAWNTRAERTCKPLGTIRYDYEGGYAGFEYETELSCGHKWRDSYGDYPNYCPNCGAKVVD